MTVVSLIVPVLNEEEAVGPFLERTQEVEAGFGGELSFEYVFVNDGSDDGTLARLLALAERRPGVVVVDLSRNFGKEAALTAGLDFASGAAVVPIDVDLQDPPELIVEMVRLWREGYEMVVARRASRRHDGVAKRVTAGWFYAVHNAIAQPRIPENVGDFRLMDRKVVDAVRALPERRRFMKGLFAWIGFRTASLDYVREPRRAGRTKFSGWRLWNFALEGLTSFSTVPLELLGYLGVLVSVGALGYGVYILLLALAGGIDVPGFASLLVAVLFLGGVQLIGLGIIGQYLGRTYMESKQRPTYVVRDVVKS